MRQFINVQITDWPEFSNPKNFKNSAMCLLNPPPRMQDSLQGA
jgi:23S rRNA A2030 N6-methylase RlmJ